MQGSELWNLAVWRVGWDGEVGVVERKLKNISQVELGVVAQTGAGIDSRLLALCDPEFPAVVTVRLLTGPICHAHENHATFPTANAAVKTLEDLGLITETTGNKKNRSFSYDRYIKLLSA